MAAGLAEHLHLRPVQVRVAFGLLCLFGGFGLLLYAVLWIVVREVPDRDSGRRRSAVPELGLALAVGVAALGAVLLLRSAGMLGLDRFTGPIALGLLGAALMWREADEAHRSRGLRAGVLSIILGGAGSSRRTGMSRVLAGLLLIVGGVGLFLALSGQLRAARDGVVATVAVLLGLALVTAPVWWRLVSELSVERRERIRSQERAELAAHVHDSVLQTLALIQRQAESPREVLRLARGQERELRTWLYRPRRPQESSVKAALENVAGEVEDAYGIEVEAVVVGDHAVDARVEALVRAAREALVNAAKHAQVAQVSLYAEVEPDAVTVFVRDRGAGFDPDAVPGDRHGLAGSIVERMQRHGGRARVSSRPGAGTEVELGLPLHRSGREPDEEETP